MEEQRTTAKKCISYRKNEHIPDTFLRLAKPTPTRYIQVDILANVDEQKISRNVLAVIGKFSNVCEQSSASLGKVCKYHS